MCNFLYKLKRPKHLIYISDIYLGHEFYDLVAHLNMYENFVVPSLHSSSAYNPVKMSRKV